jgi:hypothetical protein
LSYLIGSISEDLTKNDHIAPSVNENAMILIDQIFEFERHEKYKTTKIGNTGLRANFGLCGLIEITKPAS